MKIKTLLAVAVAAFTISPAFAQITDPSPYCDGSFDDGGFTAIPDQIKNITFGDLSNPSNAQAPGNHYIYYNNLPMKDFKIDSTYNLSITFEVNGGAGYGVWIDFNGDNVFSPNEKVSGSTAQQALDIDTSVVITGTVAIPADALTGKTRMRVRIVEDDNYTMTNGYSILPCNASNSAADIMDWGETEDYDINIIQDDTTTIPPNSIIGVNENSAFSIFPNPAQNKLSVKTRISGSYSFSIYGLSGKKLLNGKLSGNQHDIDISGLSSGVYFIQFVDKSGLLGHYEFVKKDN